MTDGTVFLVGAGPGDPELLTVKALRLIESADVVVFDRLVSADVMALVPEATLRVDVGKKANFHPVPQHEINEILVRLARQFHRVVRLKGGDPFLFGRGGEEAERLIAEGISCEVVPGITSAQGCAARLMLPLTHRDYASSLRLVTGHARADETLDLDWAGLADPQTTLVVYMGLANIAEIASQLIAHGRSPGTPVAAIANGTRADQRQVLAPLARIAATVETAGFSAPVLFVIGEVAGLVRREDFEHVDGFDALAAAQ